MRDLTAFLNLLTPRIEENLPSWYGGEARLIGRPAFYARPWSYLFRYTIQLNDTSRVAVLAKIRHLENMSLIEAMENGKMRKEMRYEYDSLQIIFDSIAASNRDDRFFAIRQLALFDDLNVLVMEEANIRTLKSHFQSVRMLLNKTPDSILEDYLDRTGQWLRLFHQTIEDVSEGDFFSETSYQKAQQSLQQIESATGQRVTHIQILLDDIFSRYKSKRLPYGIVHNNFSLSNVFVTDDKRICSFDPHNTRGPIYLDIAKLITDIDTCPIQMLTYGSAIPDWKRERLIARLVRGYFQYDTEDIGAVNLYRLIQLIEKWDETEQTMVRETGVRKLAFLLGAGRVRRYYQYLLDRQVQSFPTKWLCSSRVDLFAVFAVGYSILTIVSPEV